MTVQDHGAAAAHRLTPASRWVADELLGGRPRTATGRATTITEVRAADAADPGAAFAGFLDRMAGEAVARQQATATEQVVRNQDGLTKNQEQLARGLTAWGSLVETVDRVLTPPTPARSSS